jgi:hypothetical protein
VLTLSGRLVDVRITPVHKAEVEITRRTEHSRGDGVAHTTGRKRRRRRRWGGRGRRRGRGSDREEDERLTLM